MGERDTNAKTPQTKTMLDLRTSILLEAINTFCDTGSYQVLDKSDLQDYFPEKYAVDGVGLSQMLEFLQQHEYIDVKYADDTVCCLSPLPAGRLYFERMTEQKRENRLRYRQVGFAALLGSFLGGLLAGLLALFWR